MRKVFAVLTIFLAAMTVSFAEESGVETEAAYSSAELNAVISMLDQYTSGDKKIDAAFYRKADSLLKDYVIKQLSQRLVNVKEEARITNSSSDLYMSNYFLFSGVNTWGVTEYYFYDYILVDANGNILDANTKAENVVGMNILRKNRVYVNGNDVLTYNVDATGKIVIKVNGETINSYYVSGGVVDDQFTVAGEGNGATYYVYEDGSRVSAEDEAKIIVAEGNYFFLQQLQ